MHGLVVGRFQPLHKGHEAVVRAALAESDRVAVVIGSSDAPVSWKNPFDLSERLAMVHAAFADEIEAETVGVVPVPDLFDPPRWVELVLELVPDAGTVFGNSDWTLGLFRAVGLKVRATGLEHREVWHASRIRRQLAEGDAAWRDAVSPPVAAVLEKLQAAKRLRSLADAEPKPG